MLLPQNTLLLPSVQLIGLVLYQGDAAMQWKKMTSGQKKIHRLRLRRNHLVSELMAKDRFLTAGEANRIVRRMLGLDGIR